MLLNWVLCACLGDGGLLWIKCANVEFISVNSLVCVTASIPPPPIAASYYGQALQV